MSLLEWYLRKAVSVKKERMQQLPGGKRHEHPTPYPSWLASKPAIILEGVIREFCRSGSYVYSYRNPQLVCRIDAKRKASKTSANGWCETRGEGSGDAWISPTKRCCIFGEEVRT